MTDPYLQLKSVSYTLPDGKKLFTRLNDQFDLRHTALVGRNGVGKTMLVRIMAGQLQASSGKCEASGEVFYLLQQVSYTPNCSIAELAGVQPIMDALDRIAAGSAATADFDIVNEQWDVRQQLQYELECNGLGKFSATTRVSSLSGGEVMRVALLGAMLSKADFLILDEPTNHLDQCSRQALIERLQRWPRGLLVISHDRQLLDTMQRVVELSAYGLSSYGGNYSFYVQSKDQEQQSALRLLEHHKLEHKRKQQAMREQRERQERRQARGKRHNKDANQAKILLNRQKERNDNSSGKMREQQTETLAQISLQVQEAAQRVKNEALIIVHTPMLKAKAQRAMITMDKVELPFIKFGTRYINLILGGRQRVGIVGANGSGKSTLLKVLAGQLKPVSGTCKVVASAVYLDQQLGNLDPIRSILEQIQEYNRTAKVADLRTRLAQLGLDAARIELPSELLSAGERLKAALACVLYAGPLAPLLLLDEPNNYLDLVSVQALEAMLGSYQGCLMVASHDRVFLDNLGLTDRLTVGDQGWLLESW